MATRVDFLLVSTNRTDLNKILPDCLSETYVSIYRDLPDEEILSLSFIIRYTKALNDVLLISGVSIDFEVEPERESEVINFFCGRLASREGDGIVHVLKLNDSALLGFNRPYFDEIFEIEMKLREALSFIFIDTYGSDYYNLLKDVEFKYPGDPPETQQMKALYQNQFFYLLFSHYINLNVRKKPKNVNDLYSTLEQVADFNELKQRVTTLPITNERYVDFLASLKERMDQIEKVRNCTAHNRAIPEDYIADYNMAKGPLLGAINNFLERINQLEVAVPDDPPAHP
jgi:hypothetical protein